MTDLLFPPLLCLVSLLRSWSSLSHPCTITSSQLLSIPPFSLFNPASKALLLPPYLSPLSVCSFQALLQSPRTDGRRFPSHPHSHESHRHLLFLISREREGDTTVCVGTCPIFIQPLQQERIKWQWVGQGRRPYSLRMRKHRFTILRRIVWYFNSLFYTYTVRKFTQTNSSKEDRMHSGHTLQKMCIMPLLDPGILRC